MNDPMPVAQFLDKLKSELSKEDDKAIISASTDLLGWTRLEVVSEIFRGDSEDRDQLFYSILDKAGVSIGDIQLIGYELFHDKSEQEKKPIKEVLPLWADVLTAINPLAKSSSGGLIQENAEVLTEDNKGPQIVTFYSFKGGVGRTTALSIAASILASRDYRIAIIDMDLEAPGVSLLANEQEAGVTATAESGVVDYIAQRLFNPDAKTPSINQCTVPIKYSGPGRGEIFLIPAGKVDGRYVQLLERINMRSVYSSDSNPIHKLIADVKESIQPDIILIDSRTGFADTGAISTLDLADTAIICFSPTPQNFDGLRPIMAALKARRLDKGSPDLRFLITPLANVTAETRRLWLLRVEEWLSDQLDLQAGVRVEDLYHTINYRPDLLTLVSQINDIPDDIKASYIAVADFIDSGMPDVPLPPIVPDLSRQQILSELAFQPAAAQDISTQELPNVFQKTGDFPKFIRPSTWLVIGPKGSGKSLIFRLFVETPEAARELGKDDADLSSTKFIAVHGKPRTSDRHILQTPDLLSFEQQAGTSAWAIFWPHYTLLSLCRAYPAELRDVINLSDVPTGDEHTELVQWLVSCAKNPLSGSKCIDTLRKVDDCLARLGAKTWLFFDELDIGFSAQVDSRNKALEALLNWWIESGASFQTLQPKILLRKDIWNRLSFTNKSHYFTKLVGLEWAEPDLWRLVLRQALQSSVSFSAYAQQKLNISLLALNRLGLEQLRDATGLLWGKRMGKANKAYTHNWVRTRISDAKNNAFPRSLVQLLDTATDIERKSSQGGGEELLRPRSLINAHPTVSEQRVAEVLAEYPELKNELELLNGQRSPVDETRLKAIWGLEDVALRGKIDQLVDAGLLDERSERNSPARVYAVAELYLLGLGMRRKGQR